MVANRDGWYVEDTNHVVPISTEALNELLSTGKLNESSRVSLVMLNAWVSVAEARKEYPGIGISSSALSTSEDSGQMSAPTQNKTRFQRFDADESGEITAGAILGDMFAFA